MDMDPQRNSFGDWTWSPGVKAAAPDELRRFDRAIALMAHMSASVDALEIPEGGYARLRSAKVWRRLVRARLAAGLRQAGHRIVDEVVKLAIAETKEYLRS
jgi:hypothetical protein